MDNMRAALPEELITFILAYVFPRGVLVVRLLSKWYEWLITAHYKVIMYYMVNSQYNGINYPYLSNSITNAIPLLTRMFIQTKPLNANPLELHNLILRSIANRRVRILSIQPITQIAEALRIIRVDQLKYNVFTFIVFLLLHIPRTLRSYRHLETIAEQLKDIFGQFIIKTSIRHRKLRIVLALPVIRNYDYVMGLENILIDADLTQNDIKIRSSVSYPLAILLINSPPFIAG